MCVREPVGPCWGKGLGEKVQAGEEEVGVCE